MNQFLKKPRSTFTHSSAKIFKDIFDDCITDRKDIILSLPAGRSPAAWRTKASDALKWLVMYLDTEHRDYKGRKHNEGDYARLRGEVRFMMLHDGNTQIAFNSNKINLKVQAINPATFQGQGWKESLQKYLENPETIGKPFTLKELFLSEDDQKFAKQMWDEWSRLSNLKVIYEINPSEIYGIKTKL